jgi:hypothetical protein
VRHFIKALPQMQWAIHAERRSLKDFGFSNSLNAGKLLRIQNRTGIDETFLFETTVGFYTLAIFVDTNRLRKGSGTNSQMARRALRTIGS